MTLGVVGLAASYVLLLALLILLLLYSKLSSGFKAVVVLLGSGFYLLHYESLQQLTGWPVNDPVPEDFILIASEVIEPNPQTGEEGVMYWWLYDRDAKRPPRAYRLPYQATLHEQAQQVVQEQQQGAVYRGMREQDASQGGGSGGIGFEKIRKSELFKKQ